MPSTGLLSQLPPGCAEKDKDHALEPGVGNPILGKKQQVENRKSFGLG